MPFEISRLLARAQRMGAEAHSGGDDVNLLEECVFRREDL